MTNWRKYKLEDLAEDIAMGPFGSNIKTDNFRPSGVPVIRGQNLVEGGFDNSNFVFISEEKAESLKRSIAYPDELVFTHRGTLGQVGVIPKNRYPYYLVSQSQMRLAVKKDILNPKFLYYFFKSQIGQNELLKNVSQVGVPAIASPTKSLKDIDITIPDLPTQSRIASILSSLDDKIELNRRMNQTLEQMAQALFNHYFVDNIDPDNLPEGWKKGKVQDLFILQRGFDLPASERIHGKFEVIAASGSNGFHKTAMVKGPGITTGRSGVIGNVFYILEDFWPLNTSLYIKEFKHSTPLHAFYVLKQIDLKGLNGGSAVPTLNRNHVHSLEIAIPPKEKIVEFERRVKSLFLLKRKNEQQNITIAKIRDTLLPKLMSGEIDVSAVAKEEMLSEL
jgi:type I restriction enzyme S subunit